MAFVRTRLLSLTLVVGFGFLLMVSLILDAGLSWVGTYLEASFSGVTVILRIRIAPSHSGLLPSSSR